MHLIGFNLTSKDKELLALIQGKPGINPRVIANAIRYAAFYHQNQKRKSGEPFYHHPLEVACILSPFTDDQDTLVAALLHDTVEDTPLTLAQIAFMFNSTVASLVAGVTKFGETPRKYLLEDYEMYYKLLPGQQADKRILQIKIADRTHNMRTIKHHPSLAKQKKIAEETLRVFIPMAQHIGMPALLQELESLSLATLKKTA